MYPTHYTGEAGYISDTESSEIVPDIIKNVPESGGKPDKGSKEVGIDKRPDIEPTETADIVVPSVDAAVVAAEVAADEIIKELHVEL